MTPGRKVDDNNPSVGTHQNLKKESAIIRFCKFVYWPSIQKFIIWVIVFNSVILGLETSPTVLRVMGGVLNFLEILCIVIF
jgi:hypothetical protein